jgi:hypothetical protein
LNLSWFRACTFSLLAIRADNAAMDASIWTAPARRWVMEAPVVDIGRFNAPDPHPISWKPLEIVAPRFFRIQE